jgi:uncharacterized iron-regulated protein
MKNQKFKIKTKVGLATLVLLMAYAAAAQEQFTHLKIYSVKNREIVSLATIVDSMSAYDVVFFGEEHNDSIAHFLQDTIYKAMLKKYNNVTLSMEMFEHDCQLVLDEYLNDYITDAQLVKEGRAWKNYKDYRPMVNTAKQHQQNIIAANAPRRYVNIVSRKGFTALAVLSKESKKNFAPLPIDTVNAPYFSKFAETMGRPAPGNIKNIYYAQTLWDATMAHSIYERWKKEKSVKILHLNGRFHSDEKLGTVTQLQRKNKKLKILNISCFAAEDFNQPDWSKYEKLGDYILITDPTVAKSYK